jgi:hypothetical protein
MNVRIELPFLLVLLDLPEIKCQMHSSRIPVTIHITVRIVIAVAVNDYLAHSVKEALLSGNTGNIAIIPRDEAEQALAAVVTPLLGARVHARGHNHPSCCDKQPGLLVWIFISKPLTHQY